MLDTDTKHRIDTARDILVGKVPDPKSQVEQITIALVYKFMDDIDQESVDMGGKASFFTGEFERFTWSKIFDPRLGGYDMLALYSEAIQSMDQNPNLPQLFRDIFKNAYLPYRDPETLKLFLKTINEFKYDHSERLGDAFEYLLSVLGSQGDAGQFRTPRHLIDFMVEIVKPQKNEVILDPACGTAGFLISAYKYIMRENVNGNTLTMQERVNLLKNFKGYDISPDMVRLSLVNMYLHGFVKPQIYEYDTLSSEDRWNEYADVILANPPFMSPKGGIRPHKRFSVQSNRSEVLFVDYMAEHLTPNGRAAIIVPEGIIFQSGTAYKQLRKYLVEQKYLWAVVSLPAGVFNPYSGVKTSILLLDRAFAKKTDKILFVKVEADGFDLGAQRKQIDKNDFPKVIQTLGEWRDTINKTTIYESIGFETLSISRKQLSSNEEYNLSIERYKENNRSKQNKFHIKTIGEICKFEYGSPLKAENRIPGEYPVYGSNGIVGYHNSFIVEAPFLVVGRKGSAGKVHYSGKNGYPIDTTFYIKLENERSICLRFLYHILKSMELKNTNVQSGVPGLNRNDALKLEIPVPPLEVQNEILAEIEGYQRIIDGARQVVENWKPNIELELEEERKAAGVDAWEMVKLGEVCSFIRGPFGGSLKKEIFVKDGYLVYEQYHAINNDFTFGRYFVDQNKFNDMKRFEVFSGDILISCSGTMGKVAIVPNNHKPGIINQALLKLSPNNRINTLYLKYFLESDLVQLKHFRNQPGVAIQNVASVTALKNIAVTLPSLQQQQDIVNRIEAEREVVEANRRLIQVYKGKIKKVIERVWEG
jgi:type I restriction enzyme M protein